jgi:hypothetical protein
MPMQYLNKLLSEYHIQGINTVEEAKKKSVPVAQTVSSSKEAKKRQYTKKELDSLFDDIYEIEI